MNTCCAILLHLRISKTRNQYKFHTAAQRFTQLLKGNMPKYGFIFSHSFSTWNKTDLKFDIRRSPILPETHFQDIFFTGSSCCIFMLTHFRTQYLNVPPLFLFCLMFRAFIYQNKVGKSLVSLSLARTSRVFVVSSPHFLFLSNISPILVTNVTFNIYLLTSFSYLVFSFELFAHSVIFALVCTPLTTQTT